MDTERVKDTVKARYGQAATRAREGGDSSCCGGGGAPAACADPITSNLYDAGQEGEVPALALKASLGCGNPTALAAADTRRNRARSRLGRRHRRAALRPSRRARRLGVRPRHDRRDARAGRREQAEERARERRRSSRARSSTFPLPDNSVDVIISNCVINLSGDKDRVLREAFRVLKPGGRFAVSDVVVRGEVPAAIRKSMELWIGCVAGALADDEYVAKLARRRLRGHRHRGHARLQRGRCASVSRGRRARRRGARVANRRHIRQRVRSRHEAADRRRAAAQSAAAEPAMSRSRRLAAEFVGTALLLAAIVGSGIMGERLAGGNVAIALLANTIATGATLVALISHVRPDLRRPLQSGRHDRRRTRGRDRLAARPGVRGRADRRRRRRSHRRPRDVRRAGAAGIPSRARGRRADVQRVRGDVRAAGRDPGMPLASGLTRHRSPSALYITGAYWFTASTSFANPAVTIARSLTDTFAGIRPAERRRLHRGADRRRAGGRHVVPLAAAGRTRAGTRCARRCRH